MVSDYKEIKIETNYSMVVKTIFDKYRGKWQLMYHPKNIVSKIFWNKVVEEYTKGKYEIIKDNKEAEYRDGTIRGVLVFGT